MSLSKKQKDAIMHEIGVAFWRGMETQTAIMDEVKAAKGADFPNPYKTVEEVIERIGRDIVPTVEHCLSQIEKILSPPPVDEHAKWTRKEWLAALERGDALRTKDLPGDHNQRHALATKAAKSGYGFKLYGNIGTVTLKSYAYRTTPDPEVTP